MAKKRDSELAALRAEVQRLHGNATRKVSRMRTQGTEIGGSPFDPRRNTANVKRYNRVQLNAYARELRTFNNRSVGYVQLKSGELVTRQAWQQYSSAVQSVNRQKRELLAQYQDVPIDPLNITVGEAVELQTTNKPVMDTAMNSPFREKAINPKQISNKAALQRLTAEARSLRDETVFSRSVREAREQANRMAKESGMHSTAARLDGLSDEAFFTLWGSTGFANSLSVLYHAEAAADGRTTRGQSRPAQINDDVLRSLRNYGRHDSSSLLDWAESL